ncbi:hypothetical protein TSOC_007335, partial [Tetrabaena socialis]
AAASANSSSSDAAALPGVSLPLAVVNARTFHLEVLSAALEAVRAVRLVERTAVYVDKFVHAGKDGWRSLVHDYDGPIIAMPPTSNASQVPRHEVVFFISPEKSPEYTRFFINASRPSVVVLMIHNAQYPQLAELVAMHPRTRLVVLSPHVATALRARGFEAAWWLAARPWLQPPAPGGEGAGAAGSTCKPRDAATPPGPWGFVCQGRIDNRRRSYDSVWAELQAAADAADASGGGSGAGGGGDASRAAGRRGAAGAGAVSGGGGVLPPPRLTILGRAVPKQYQVAIPRRVRRLVTTVTDAPYDVFYGHIACSVALLPLFANESYLTSKFSSTVLASLSTGTPMLVEPRFLSAYSFLDEQILRSDP